MKKILDAFFSAQVSLVLLLIFAIAIGSATFLEEKFDTTAAQVLVYQANWFNLLLALLALNFLGMTGKYRMFSRKKAAMLTFHLAFVLMILGAALTRFVGFEGTMHIREGRSSNTLFTAVPYLQVTAGEGEARVDYERELILSPYLDNDFSLEIPVPGGKEIGIRYKDYIPNAQIRLEERVAGGVNTIELVYAVDHIQQTLFLREGEVADMGPVKAAFHVDTAVHAIRLSSDSGRIMVSAPADLFWFRTGEQTADTLFQNTRVVNDPSRYFSGMGVSFMVKNLYASAKKRAVPGPEGSQGAAALVVDVTYNGEREEMILAGGSGFAAGFTETTLGGMKIRAAHGDKVITLPFSLYLNDFILERYAGSKSPSSYASEVTLTDRERNVSKPYRIYMNHVLDYRGYRFFQSSYDMDEQGTILSVNHDKAGTLVTYAAYALLAAGFILSMLSRHSRFHVLGTRIREAREKRKSLITVMVFLSLIAGGSIYGQQQVQPPVSPEHAGKFGKLLVQTYDGRFQPVHTLATDALRKISRKDRFDAPGKGNLDAVQVLIDMLIDPEYWKQQNIVYVREKSIRDKLGAGGKHVSIYDFYDQQGKYKLGEAAEISFRKKPSQQNSFDKEIIRLDERLNVFISVLNGNMIRIFPEKGSANHHWLSPYDSLSFLPLSGDLGALAPALGLDRMTYNDLMRMYYQKVTGAVRSGDFTGADEVLGIIGAAQRNLTPGTILPSARKVGMEVYYNDANIFVKLRNWYGILSVILLILAFVDVLNSKKSRALSISLNLFTALLALAFLYHTFGLGLRWYLSDHAPWSNGYEALLLVAWGSLLAGFLFGRHSKVTLAATVVMAASMLMTASHSSYDPQLTNLQPVLKSYWLIIHVAVITISYGFLGLGFVLGLLNLFISLFKTMKNKLKLGLIIKELTYINEKNLTAGLFLATMGTFLGGVWANESWGRYWGWDAKETWALVIIIVYAIILHFRFVPGLKSVFAFNAGSVLGFGSVLMTFIGVNYYLSKGLHSYAADDTPVFPLWAWVMIVAILLLMLGSWFNDRRFPDEAEGRET